MPVQVKCIGDALGDVFVTQEVLSKRFFRFDIHVIAKVYFCV